MSEYEQLGVSPSKEEVHQAVRKLPPSPFPNAFARILKKGDRAFALHVDTAGTKPALAYIYWRETGDLNVWRWIARDAIVMNIDDLACAGFTTGFSLASNIARNKHIIPAEVIETIIDENIRYCAWLQDLGIECMPAGGETADVGDIVRTIDVGITAHAEMPADHVRTVSIRPGDVVIGIASEGRCRYDPDYNSGIGSNGLTLARHAVLHREYARKYPETLAPQSPPDAVYRGDGKVTDRLTIADDTRTLGQLLLSPTRTYLPYINKVWRTAPASIHGMIHCTGGGQTKVLHFLKNVRVVKDALFPVPPVFRIIQEKGGVPWKEMYRVFNMGHRLELYIRPESADVLIAAAQALGLSARVIGRCEPADRPAVRIYSVPAQQWFEYA